LSDVDFLGNLKELRQLTVIVQRIGRISALRNLPSLRLLRLGEVNADQLDTISSLTQLADLHLSLGQGITDLRQLGSLQNLIALRLRGTELPSIDGLAQLSGLSGLELFEIPKVESVSAISALVGLKSLTLYSPQLTSFEFVRQLPRLERLILACGPSITRLDDLELCENLLTLELRGPVQIESFRPLANMKRLESLTLPWAGHRLRWVIAGVIWGRRPWSHLATAVCEGCR
jgi:hypothetical protein